MSTVLEQRSLPRRDARRAPWVVLGLALALLYAPLYAEAARGLWRDDAYAHGPIVLAVFYWLVWRNLYQVQVSPGEAIPLKPVPGTGFLVAGFLLVLLALVAYVIGRSFEIPLFAMGSHVPLFVGLALVVGGVAALRAAAFPLVFLLFAIPLPGFILEAATAPLARACSAIVAAVLNLFGYGVERAGVVLAIGDQQMLVADACAGLNSLFSLAALGLLYAHLTGPLTARRLAVLAAAFIPIALAANALRVLVLVLVAHHFGDEAAMGWIHGATGIATFIGGLLMLVAIDKKVSGKRLEVRGEHATATLNPSPLTPHPLNWSTTAIVSTLFVGAVVAALLLKPVRAEGPGIDLERIVPAAFGDWHIDPTIEAIAPTPDVKAKLDRIYKETLTRTYVNGAGEHMMVTLAYGGDQSDALKAHRQEVCYRAQGFEIAGLHADELAVDGRRIPVTRMVATRGERVEPVTYWLTMGDRVVLSRTQRLGAQIQAGFHGRIPDGMLVRLSSLSGDAAGAFAAQQAFAAALFAAIPQTETRRFIGAAQS